MPKKILLVDDNPDILSLLAFKLQDEGYEVTTATNGKQCVEKALEIKPDLILLDVMMPIMDGTEAAQEMRNYPETRTIPIIFLTALISGTELAGIIKGEHRVVSKAIKFPELFSIIKVALGETQ